MNGWRMRWLALTGMALTGMMLLLAGGLGAQVDDPPPAETATGDGAMIEGLGAPTTLAAVRRGGLLLATTARGVYLPAPTLDTEVTLTVRGMVAEADVRQRFTNPTDQWVEGVYVFPLPDNAAVDRLRLVVGERVIEGEIHERQEARRVYEQAREQGQRAALVEQQRPNLFTSAVANLGPHETVEVRIGFRQEVQYADGTFGLRFPLAVTPRFEPAGTPPSPVELAGGASTALPAQAVGCDLDNDLGISSRQLATTSASGPASGTASGQAASRPRPGVALRVRLDPGIAVARIGSTSHAVRTTRRAGGFDIALEDGSVAADRDFVLEWQPPPARAPQVALITEAAGLDTFGLLMVVPPEHQNAGPRQPRETIFVIDVSGSMDGPSIVQAKAALDDALSRLETIDHLNVISFAEDVVALHDASVPATPARIAEARRWVAKLGIRGGTYMLPALEAALATDGIDRGLRQVIFITDGAVGNEDQLFALIDSRLGDTRLFPVGIGAAPNSHFMRTAARFGRGTFTHIASVDEVAGRMAALYRKLEQPVLTDLEVVWDDPNVEAWPARVGDLYAGEPLVIAARLPSGNSGLTVTGRRAGQREEYRLEHGEPASLGAGEPAAITRLWARRKVAELRDAMVRGDVRGDARGDSHAGDRASLRQAVIEVALEHHLVTDFTSLVAVDRTPVAPAGIEPVRRAVPLPLPAGWQNHPGVASLPLTATPFKAWLLLAGLLAAAAMLAGRRREAA